MPPVTMLRRCSSAASGGENDAQTSASISVSALPGRPDGNVPRPSTCRSPSSPRPGMARTVSSGADAAPAAGETKIASTWPTVAGAALAGGRASAMSAAATTNPSSSRQPSAEAAPEGSNTMPDGTPYITTASRSDAPGGRPHPSHGPGHENAAGSATGTRPRPSPPSQRETRQPATSSPGGVSGTAPGASSRMVARQAAKVAAAEARVAGTSRIGRDDRPRCLVAGGGRSEDGGRRGARGERQRQVGQLDTAQIGMVEVDRDRRATLFGQTEAGAPGAHELAPQVAGGGEQRVAGPALAAGAGLELANL